MCCFGMRCKLCLICFEVLIINLLFWRVWEVGFRKFGEWFVWKVEGFGDWLGYIYWFGVFYSLKENVGFDDD